MATDVSLGMVFSLTLVTPGHRLHPGTRPFIRVREDVGHFSLDSRCSVFRQSWPSILRDTSLQEKTLSLFYCENEEFELHAVFACLYFPVTTQGGFVSHEMKNLGII